MMTPIIMMHLHGTKVYSVYTFSYLPNDVSGGGAETRNDANPDYIKGPPIHVWTRGARQNTGKKIHDHACMQLFVLFVTFLMDAEHAGH